MQPDNKNRWKKIFLVILVLAVIGAATSYLLWNKPHQDVASSKAAKVLASDLYQIFSADSFVANKQYLQQVVLVSGLLKEVSTNQQQQVVAKLVTGVEGAYINCTFEERMPKLITGDTVTVKGICGGLDEGNPELGIPGDLYLLRCYISK